MLAALRQSPEPKHLIDLAKKYLTGVKGTIVQAKKIKAERATQLEQQSATRDAAISGIQTLYGTPQPAWQEARNPNAATPLPSTVSQNASRVTPQVLWRPPPMQRSVHEQGMNNARLLSGGLVAALQMDGASEGRQEVFSSHSAVTDTPQTQQAVP